MRFSFPVSPSFTPSRSKRPPEQQRQGRRRQQAPPSRRFSRLLRPRRRAAAAAAAAATRSPLPFLPPLPFRQLLPLGEDHVVPGTEHPRSAVLGQPRGERHRVNQSELQPEQRRPQQVGPDAELRVVPLPGGPVERREQGEPGPGGEVRAEEGGGEGPGPEACDEGELERDLESFSPRFFRFFFSCETFFPISVGRRSNSKLEKRKKRTRLSHHSDDRQEHRLPEGPDVVARGARAPGAHREEEEEEEELGFRRARKKRKGTKKTTCFVF